MNASIKPYATLKSTVFLTNFRNPCFGSFDRAARAAMKIGTMMIESSK